MPLFLYIYSYIHSYNHSLITFAEALLHIFIAAGGTKPKFEHGPSNQQACALPFELHCTQNLSSDATPFLKIPLSVPSSARERG